MGMDLSSLIRDGTEYYDEDIAGRPEWEAHYHLSSLRKASFCWYPFAQGSRILEVGCGCGAVTGSLAGKAGKLDAVEIDPERAAIAGRRYAGRPNVQIHTADIFSFRQEEPYDYIVAAELLEDLRGSAEELLQKLYTMLIPGGVLLLGFRNRYGLKYLCGAEDEYTGTSAGFAEKKAGEKKDCPAGKRAQGLCDRAYVTELAGKAGFRLSQFFYPLPDFGFTQAVYSDAWLPDASVRDRVLPYDPFGEDAEKAIRVFEEYDRAIANGFFDKTANCVLLELERPPETDLTGKSGSPVPEKAGNDPAAGKTPGNPRLSGVHGALLSADRERGRAYATVLSKDKVIKQALYPEGKQGLEDLISHASELEAGGIPAVPQILRKEENRIVMPRIQAEPLTDHLKKSLRNGPQEAIAVFDRLREDILRSSEIISPEEPGFSEICEKWNLSPGQIGPVLKKGFPDMIPYNAFFEDGRLIFTDQEFALENCPAKYILYRAVRYTWLHIPEAERILPQKEMRERYGLNEVWEVFTRFEDAFTEKNRNRRLYRQFYHWAWDRKPYDTGFVMGVFDLFHRGHLNLLERAKSRCRHLRVGVLSDELVMFYKKHRPEIPLADRMRILQALSCVDEVVAVEGEYVSKIAEWYRRPYDCFFSGDDYIDNEYWKKEKEELKKLGADLEFFSYTEGISSTMLREKLRGKGEGR